MTKNKDTIRAAIVAALLIALMALALIGAFGVVTVNAEESSSPATFDFPAATKIIGEGDTYTVNYYSPNGDKIAEQTVPYMSTVPMIAGYGDYSVVYDIVIPEEGFYSFAGVTGDENVVRQYNGINVLTGYLSNSDGVILAVLPFDVSAATTVNFDATVDDQSIALDELNPFREFGHIQSQISGDYGDLIFGFAGVLDSSTIMISALSVDGVELIHNNIATVPIDILNKTSMVDVVNLIVNDYDGGEVDFLNFSTKFVSGTTESVTVNFLSPDLKPISSTTITADKTLPVLAGYDNYTMIQKYSQGDGSVISIDGVTVDYDDSIIYSKYGIVYEHTGKSYPHTRIYEDYSDIIDVDVPYSYNISGTYTGLSKTFIGSNLDDDAEYYLSITFDANSVTIGDYRATHKGFNSFNVNGYDYVREDGLMQFPYTAEQLAGFTPSTDVINLIVDDYVSPEPDDPATPTPGGDTGEIDQPDNPTVTAPDGNWFTETWDKIVQWFKDAGEAIKNWFIEVGQWFKELFN